MITVRASTDLVHGEGTRVGYMFHKASPPPKIGKTDQLKHFANIDATFSPKPFDAEDTVSS